MASKPFGIQSPEQIAKDYGGNKQRIAEAMQLGIVDPTIGTLAGMFIDRMAAGAAQGQGPQGTVASQVFNPQTPPAQAPGGAGLGGLPMGMGPPPPDMGMGMGAPPPDMGMGAPPPDMPMPPPSPEQMQPMSPGMADGGMVAFARGGESRPLDLQSLLPFPEAGLPEEAGFADGGVASLPVPDDMFNSSVGDNQQYADGGMVAFAEGGTYGKFRELIIERESGGNYAARNKQSGAMGKYQVMPDTARALAKRLGMEYNPALMTSNTEAGRAYQDAIGNAAIREAYDYGRGDMAKAAAYYQGGPNTRIHGAENRKYQAAIARGMGQPMARRATLAATPDAPAVSREGLAAANMPSEELQAMREQMRANAAERAADKKDRKQAGWAALAQRGLAMMSPQGAEMPSLFADGGTVPGYAVAGPVLGALPAVKDPADAFKPDYLTALQSNISGLMPQSTKYADLMMEDVERRRNPETARTERKQVANMALMNFGLALMATKNPNFLGALGESGAPAVAGMKADLKDLKKQARDATFEAAQLEGLSNKESREKVNTAEAGIARAVAITHQNRVFDEGVRQFGITSGINRTEAEARLVAARKATAPSDFALQLQIMLTGTPAQKKAVTDVISAKAKATAAAQAAAGGYPGATGNSGGGGPPSTSGWGEATEVK
jgi:hypothetical protein